MLVLTRRLGELIRIGDEIKVTVLEVRSGQVKLGVEAPTATPVHREEVYARIHGGVPSPRALRRIETARRTFRPRAQEAVHQASHAAKSPGHPFRTFS